MHASILLKLSQYSLLAFSFLVPELSAAGCSRPINVPISATGLSVIVRAESVSGIYPDLLRSIAEKEGCQFVFTVVPRARLEAMFEAGKADILIPASKTPRRDDLGLFVPLIHSRATLISIQSNRPPIKTAQDLIERQDLRLALVRGFDYGDTYQTLVAELTRQGRVFMESDVVSVARLMKAGSTYLTIMAPSIFDGAIRGDARVEELLGQLRYEPINELPWGDSGVYLSKTSLSKSDTEQLRQIFERTSRSGVVWKNFQRYYQPDLLKEGIRPLNSSH
ncbi:MAG: transporter substrate-binding domain-containing protein [Undibacterium sp.]|nr:transporter substrate-binding domain-containing protein [Undibacterium sp.]